MSQPSSRILTALYTRQAAVAAELAAAAAVLTPWEAAALGRDDALADLLAADPAAADAIAADGHTPLGLAAFFTRGSTVRLLLDHGADLEAVSRNEMQVRPLHAAVAGRDAGIVSMLLERGANVNARQQVGYTPLMGAASAGREDLVEILLQYGADPSLVADDGQTAAGLARGHEHHTLAAQLDRLAMPASEG